MVGNTIREAPAADDSKPATASGGSQRLGKMGGNSKAGEPDLSDPRLAAMHVAFLGAEAAEEIRKATRAVQEEAAAKVAEIMKVAVAKVGRAVLVAQGYDMDTADAQKEANAAMAVAGADPTSYSEDTPQNAAEERAKKQEAADKAAAKKQ